MLFFSMNGSGSGNLDHFFARFHDLIGERNHFFLHERERELNHFFRELPIPCYSHKNVYEGTLPKIIQKIEPRGQKTMVPDQ